MAFLQRVQSFKFKCCRHPPLEQKRAGSIERAASVSLSPLSSSARAAVGGAAVKDHAAQHARSHHHFRLHPLQVLRIDWRQLANVLGQRLECGRDPARRLEDELDKMLRLWASQHLERTRIVGNLKVDGEKW